MIHGSPFDYVIVGAGSAGCVLASRLTEDPSVRVLLLEAGGWDRDPMIHVPLGVGILWGQQRHDWRYETEPERNLGNARVKMPRGRVVGGSSSINALAYVRGNRADYDRWATHGLAGWSYAHALPYFRRSEHWEEGETPWRGGSGPLHVRRTRTSDPLFDRYLEAVSAAGQPIARDHNGASQEGVGWHQWTVRGGRRCSSAVAYLRPALKRGNLHVEVGAHATRVLFSGTRATGVEYMRGGQVVSAEALREVLVCGGAINSPQVLMLSGIGDANQLRQHGIASVVHSPNVGNNLQDHFVGLVTYERREPGPFLALMRADRVAAAMARAYFFGSGPATDLPSGLVGFLRTGPDEPVPDMQMFFRAAAANAGAWFPGWRPPWKDTFTMRPVLLRPESRGTVRLRSPDPFERLRVSQNYLSTDRDLRTLRNGIRLLRDIASQQSLNALRGREIYPGSEVRSDAEIDAYIRTQPGTAHHPAGTCRMGVDDGAVVDAELRVKGAEGLRVIDASVFPDLIGGNINAAVMMVAERASDLILGRAPLPPFAPQ